MNDEIQQSMYLLHISSSIRSLHRFPDQSSQDFCLSSLNLRHFDREILNDAANDFLERRCSFRRGGIRSDEVGERGKGR